MTSIGSLLTPEQQQTLEQVKANLASQPEPQPEAILGKACGALRCSSNCEGFMPSGTVQDGFKLCACTHSEQSHTGIKAVKPEPQPALADAPVTVINGVEIDLRSEGWISLACADCEQPLMVEIAPKGVDLSILTAMPRTACCPECARTRIVGKRGVVIHDATVTEPEWKEEPVLDLNDFTNAELGVMAGRARDLAEAEEAANLAKRREKALREEAEREARDKAQLRADRAKQGKHKAWFGAFSINAKVVPALDFTDVNLAEQVPSEVRSPYNKALFSLREDLLAPDVTYAEVRKLHKRLWKRADAAVEPQVERLVAVVDPTAKAKVEAFANATGKTYEQALEHLTKVGVV